MRGLQAFKGLKRLKGFKGFEGVFRGFLRGLRGSFMARSWLRGSALPLRDTWKHSFNIWGTLSPKKPLKFCIFARVPSSVLCGTLL